jgi:hypothetical protein
MLHPADERVSADHHVLRRQQMLVDLCQIAALPPGQVKPTQGRWQADAQRRFSSLDGRFLVAIAGLPGPQ